MNGEIIRGRPRAIFRILSVLTIVVGTIGFSITAYGVATGLFGYKMLGYIDSQTHPRAAVLLYFAGSADLLLNIVFVYAGTLLWKLRRKGLWVLSYVLITELMYLVVFSMAVMGSPMHSSGVHSKGYAYILGVGMLPFGVQVLTAFPIVAGFLIFFAYRYLGIPARPME